MFPYKVHEAWTSTSSFQNRFALYKKFLLNRDEINSQFGRIWFAKCKCESLICIPDHNAVYRTPYEYFIKSKS